MSSDRLKTQSMFESIMISHFSLNDFQDLKESNIKGYVMTSSNVSTFRNALRQDSIDFYYKGLISLCEAMVSLQNKGWSWSTVKFYYSVFYFLRSSLCIKGIGFVRKARELYYFSTNEHENFKRIKSPDHKAAIDTYVQIFKSSDILQSNNIDDKNCYHWIMSQRENINYKHRTFFEPDVPEIWQTIASSIEADGYEYWINKYLTDPIYSFLEDHAILAVPIKRHAITFSELIDGNAISILNQEKVEGIKNIIFGNTCLSFLKGYYPEHNM